MALKFKATGGGGDFKTVPSGSHIAVCDLVAECGLQPGSALFPSPKQKVYIRFEIPAERVEYERDGKKLSAPAVIGSFFTASMQEKATLRKQLEGWRGKKFTDSEASDFDVAAILGKACMLTVVENMVGDKTYANIASISPLPKGIPSPVLENNPILYTLDDERQYSELPQWLQEKISNRIKPKAESPTGIYATPEVAARYDFGNIGDGTEITDEDIPF